MYRVAWFDFFIFSNDKKLPKKKEICIFSNIFTTYQKMRA